MTSGIACVVIFAGLCAAEFIYSIRVYIISVLSVLSRDICVEFITSFCYFLAVQYVFLLFTQPPMGEQCIVMSVCLSIRENISRIARPTLMHCNYDNMLVIWYREVYYRCLNII